MNSVSEKIKEEIAKSGVIPFERFMEMSLYCPVCGYYEKEADIVGSRGDFYTSVSVGSLFGELVAFQFAEWFEEIKSVEPEASTFKLIEAGAHDGQLASDILNWLQSKRPLLFERIEYGIIEPSQRRREWQKEKLGQLAPRVRWFDALQNLGSKTPCTALRTPHFSGIMFSNELLDAMPVCCLGWDAEDKKWFEWGVTVENDKFVWTRIANRDSRFTLPSSIRHLPSSLLDVLPDHYTIEISPAAENWWCEAASILERGRLMAIDYGFTFDELFMRGRTQGTLRGYFRHHVTDDVLENPGEQDITADVNFSAVQATGESVGLATETFCTQSQFLTQIFKRTLNDKSFSAWDTTRTRQFQTLTHPEHLGRPFRILVQTR